MTTADTVVLADTVHSPEPSLDASPLEAIGITAGRISHLGDRNRARSWIGPHTSVHDFGPATITPGLVDAHTHPVLGQASARGVFLGDADTLAEAAAALREHARSLPADAWVLGWGLTQALFGSQMPNSTWIDEAVPDRLALVQLFDGHAALASARALQAAGVTGERDFPDGSRIGVDETGRPTGFLRELGAMDLVHSLVPQLTFDEKVAGVSDLFTRMAAAGLTGVEMLDFEDPDSLAVLAEIERRCDLPLKVRVAPWILAGHDDSMVETVIGLQGRRGRRFEVRGAKLMIDGTVDNGTAWLYEPDTQGECLSALWTDLDRYRTTLSRLHHAEVTTTTHAIGDQSIGFVAEALRDLPPNGTRHRIEHIETLTDADLEVLAESGASASMQPSHCTHFVHADGSDAWSRRLGRERAHRGYRIRDVLDAGVTLALGSDWPVAPFDPRAIMADARTRRRTEVPGARAIEPNQRLTALEALAGYTCSVHASTGSGGGRIRLGAAADLTVFGDDPLRLTPEQLLTVPIVGTVLDGSIRRITDDGVDSAHEGNEGSHPTYRREATPR